MAAEQQRREGLASRVLFSFTRAPLMRSLKYKHLFNAIFAPVVKNLFRLVLRRFSPLLPASESKTSAPGAFTFSDRHERLFETLAGCAQMGATRCSRYPERKELWQKQLCILDS